MLPPEPRLPDARRLIEGGQYFVVHAPRQTGKTTVLNTLAHSLTAAGRHAAVVFSCERAEPAGDDYGAAEVAVLGAIAEAATVQLPEELLPPDPWPDASPLSRIITGLRAWAKRCPLPLVLFFDEIDALRGESLRSVLRQLRDGYQTRPASFPASVVLCGLRDVRDYRVASGGDASRLGTASPFNISVESLRIGDFRYDDIVALYGQHAAETGQEFSPGAFRDVFHYSQGQPWLVNAFAREIIQKMGMAPPRYISATRVQDAKERLILARATHLDSLAAKLSEPRVRRVIEPVLAGTMPTVDATWDDDVAYVRDLGLIAQKSPVQIANPVYREVIARVLGAGIEEVISAKPQRFVLPDGTLDVRALLEAFASFWCEHGETLALHVPYREAAPQVVFMAFLQRIVNGGGYVDREYAVGSGRIDLLVRKPHGDCQEQREAVELKMWHLDQPDPLSKGLEQLDGYLERLALSSGTLVIFDRRPDAAPIAERTGFSSAKTASGRAVTVLRG
jgi:hypothetical protein